MLPQWSHSRGRSLAGRDERRLSGGPEGDVALDVFGYGRDGSATVQQHREVPFWRGACASQQGASVAVKRPRAPPRSRHRTSVRTAGFFGARAVSYCPSFAFRNVLRLACSAWRPLELMQNCTAGLPCDAQPLCNCSPTLRTVVTRSRADAPAQQDARRRRQTERRRRRRRLYCFGPQIQITRGSVGVAWRALACWSCPPPSTCALSAHSLTTLYIAHFFRCRFRVVGCA